MQNSGEATLKIRKAALDIGIVTRKPEAMLAFYRDVLGLKLESVMEMPGGGVMNRLRVGDSLLKIIQSVPEPPHDVTPGGIRTATGCRYWTIHISNLDESLDVIEREGYKIRLGRKTIRRGVDIAMIEDPDGNWLELVEKSRRRWIPWSRN